MQEVESRVQVKNGLVLVIPTRNRGKTLRTLLESIRFLSFMPDSTIVVDASDEFRDFSEEFSDINLIHLNSERASAAFQRNMGIETAVNFFPNFQFIAFLDDDVTVNLDYFQNTVTLLNNNPDFIGISGLALYDQGKPTRRNKVLDFFGWSGSPGSLTKSIVNISPQGLETFKQVDWLIGCSVWRRRVVESLRFEADFQGQSLFEDVIFSVRASELGKLGCDPNIIIRHNMSTLGRPNLQTHFQDWIVNRHRLFRYTKSTFSKRKYWTLNYLLLLRSLVLGIFNSRHRKIALGLFKGIIAIQRAN